jgi:hypothetical protein
MGLRPSARVSTVGRPVFAILSFPGSISYFASAASVAQRRHRMKLSERRDSVNISLSAVPCVMRLAGQRV